MLNILFETDIQTYEPFHPAGDVATIGSGIHTGSTAWKVHLSFHISDIHWAAGHAAHLTSQTFIRQLAMQHIPFYIVASRFIDFS